MNIDPAGAFSVDGVAKEHPPLKKTLREFAANHPSADFPGISDARVLLAPANATPYEAVLEAMFEARIAGLWKVAVSGMETPEAAYFLKDRGPRAVRHVGRARELEEIRVRLIGQEAGPNELLIGDLSLGVLAAEGANEPILRALTDRIRNLRAGNTDEPVVFDGSPDARFGTVLATLNAVTSAGVRQATIAFPDSAAPRGNR